MLLNRESITNSVVMIQPSLLSYSFNSPPAPALLDVASIAVDRILLLDAYFSVVIFHGMTIAQWRNMGYHKQPEHQVICHMSMPPNFQLVDAPIVIIAISLLINFLFNGCFGKDLFVEQDFSSSFVFILLNDTFMKY